MAHGSAGVSQKNPSVAFGAEAFASLSVIGNLSGIRSGYDGG
jgi:hypothetical protein